MSLANSKTSAIYQEALAATSNQGWESGGVGFTEKSQNPGNGTVSQQLNTILFIVIQQSKELVSIRDEVQQIHTRVKELQKAKAPTAAAAPDIKADLDNITAKLSSLNLGAQKPKETGGNLKVYRNPYDILKETRK